MAFDTFLKIDGVPGESTDSANAGSIEIYSFSWGASNPVTVGSGTTGSGGGKVVLSSFNVMKKTDKSSPKLFSACCAGNHFATATVTMRKAGGQQNVFLTYEFKQVFVESIQWSGSSGGDDSPAESVSFAYGAVTTKYTPQKKDGSMDSPIPAGWDLTTNKSS